ncbi:copper oxidase [Actinotalea ferrariae CF5-4]|uniref:Copper oxidase n=1 Tax=Actinotalea ferrariae CF5-4 TaxID=948458 RepID=A0A021VTU7_9CELL|nr:multicopper oxidase family protein [Actinotalea ferrariae]EYR62492.1 copper oxidase [Actinotalea ferrariae CF5-4]
MEPVTRRQALQLGTLGALGVVVGGAGLARSGVPWAPLGQGPSPGGTVGGGLAEPTALRSTNGLLRVELIAAEQEVVLAGRQARALAYNGQVPGQTWWVRPGDRIEVRLENRLGSPTNLHTHGLHVSPQGSSDNALLSIDPATTFDYRFELPPDHPTGVFWYHPHRHGHVADQIFGGLYGTIIVEDDDAPGARDRVLVISDTSLTPEGQVRGATAAERMMGREGDLVLVNGQVEPVITSRPGELERWRVVNASTSRYLRLALPGQQLQLLGTDSGQEATPRDVDDVVLAPGNRADLLVRMQGGAAQLHTLGYDRGGRMMGMMTGRTQSGPLVLAHLDVTGDSVDGPAAVVRRAAQPDLREASLDGRREIAFTMTTGRGGGMGAMMDVGFDGRPFDIERTDQQVLVDSVEEWTIRNPTPMNHPFHLHVWPMQVLEINGVPMAGPVWRDVVDVPAQGEAVVRIRFGTFSGRTVYHCHILDHEDAGMMGIIAASPA